MSGAGKSTLAQQVAARLAPACALEILDGDAVRSTFWPELGFTREARDANVLRIGHLAHLLARNHVAAIVAAVSPYADTRAKVREQARAHNVRFVEVFVTASLDALIARDPKGLYRRALDGDIKQFTGISDPYEPPPNPEAIVHTDRQSVDESLEDILQALARAGAVPVAVLGHRKQPAL
jgi:adenylylsulfate kinase